MKPTVWQVATVQPVCVTLRGRAVELIPLWMWRIAVIPLNHGREN